MYTPHICNAIRTANVIPVGTYSIANEIVHFVCSAEMTNTNTVMGVSCKDGSNRGSYVHVTYW